jgi:N-acetylglutamate synthase-like GNAT family acetyltransferase
MRSGHVRRAGIDDVYAIRELSRAAYAKWVPLIGREPWPMTADYGRAIAEYVIDLLEENGRLVALIELIPRADHLLIENVAVQPEQQGKGLGERMLRHAEDVARSMNYTEIRLYTNAVFAANIAFYSKRGYQEYERGTMVPGTVAVHMKKSIPDEPSR